MESEGSMSTDERAPEERQRQEQTYLWLGYGGYPGPWEAAAFNPTNIRAAPAIFDWLFELFGVKERESPEADRD
jgi:hypothetical protein